MFAKAIATIRNLVHSNPCICDFCPNQPFL
jgi:hypothetical protein